MSSDEGPIANGYVSDDEPINNIEETEEVQRDSERDEDNQNETREVVKPKKIVRNPQPKLNAETLKGPRGIAAIESYFQRVKFKGKGHEVQDLSAIMKTYEYWCHRLFPKFPFEVCIERLEKLGTKKGVQTHIKRIRYDLLVKDEPVLNNSDDEPMADGFVDVQEDEIMLQNPQFNQLLLPSTAHSPSASVELTENQKERIRLNKEKAEKIRHEKLRSIKEKSQEMLAESSSLSSNEVFDKDKEIFDSIENKEHKMQDIDALLEDINGDNEETFDYESTLKGKKAIKGVVYMKKSLGIFRSDEETVSSKKNSASKKKGVIDSDSDEVESYTNKEKIETSVNGVDGSTENSDNVIAASQGSLLDVNLNINEENSDDTT